MPYNYYILVSFSNREMALVISLIFCLFELSYNGGDIMAKKGEQYNYRIVLKYIDSSNVEVEIDSTQLQYILIDKDFDEHFIS